MDKKDRKFASLARRNDGRICNNISNESLCDVQNRGRIILDTGAQLFEISYKKRLKVSQRMHDFFSF